MIYNIDARFLFVHIPRTGGMAITAQLLKCYPDSYVDTTHNRHLYGVDCLRLDRLIRVPDLYRFAVIRNPWKIIESEYRLCIRDIGVLHPYSKMEHSSKWYDKLKRVSRYKSFTEYAAREFLGRDIVKEGGFWRTWCLGRDNADLNFDILRFETLDKDWNRIVERLNLPKTPLKKLNDSTHLGFPAVAHMFENCGSCPNLLKTPSKTPLPIRWSPAARDAIGELCCQDVEEFGYEFQGELA